MAKKVLFCVPVYYGLVISLVFQVVVDTAYGVWFAWWLSKGHDDDVEILKTLDGCIIAFTIWELYSGFVAAVGLYGALTRKRFMKNFFPPQAFVLVCHIAISVWYIVVYTQFDKDEDVQDCKVRMEKGGDDEETETCRHLLGFQTAPLSFVCISFVLEVLIQTLVIYFLLWYRIELNEYKIVDMHETMPLEESSAVGRHLTVARETRPNESSLMETTELPPSDSAAGPLVTPDPGMDTHQKGNTYVTAGGGR